MKTLRKISVSQLTELKKLAFEEMVRIIGGEDTPGSSGCVFGILAYIYNQITLSNDKDSSYFAEAWHAYCVSNNLMYNEETGNPYVNQKQALYDFIGTMFETTTGESFLNYNYSGMIEASASSVGVPTFSGIAFVVIPGSGNNQHAIAVSGAPDINGYYNCYDANEGQGPVRYTRFLFGTGIGRWKGNDSGSGSE